jgi:hypothetical protein
MPKKILIFITLISLLVGCNAQSKEGINSENAQDIIETSKSGITETTNSSMAIASEDEPATWSELEGILPSSFRNNEEWEEIDGVIKYMGKTANEIVEMSGYRHAISYVKKGEIEQLIMNGDLIFKFPGRIWYESSQCRAVEIQGYYAIKNVPRIPKDFITMYGGNPVWYEPEEGYAGYFQYNFDDGIEVKFYINKEDSEEDDNIIVSYTDESQLCPEEMLDYSSPYIIDINERENREWEIMERYMLYLGKSVDELKGEFPNYVRRYDSLEDEDTGVYFGLENGTNCFRVGVPSYLFFKNMENDNGTIGRDDIMKYWPVNHTWYVYEGSFYSFKFEDISVCVYSELDGTLKRNAYVTIERGF